MKNKSTIILAAIFIVLIVVYFITTYRPPEVTSGAYLLFEDGLPSIDRIEMSEPGQPKVVLVRRDGSWYMEDPFEFKADDRYVNNLVSQINEVMIDGVISTRVEAQAEYQVGDSSGVSLKVLSGDDTVLDCLVGKRSQDVGHSYARRRGSEEIELWRSMLAMEVRREVDQWRDRTVYSINSDDIIRIEAVEGNDTRTLAFADTVWTYSENGVEKAVDTTRVREVAAQIAELVCDDFASASDIEQMIDRDYDVEVSFTIRNGDVNTYHVWRPQEQSTRYLMRKAGGDVLYRFTQYKGSRISIDYENLTLVQ